MTQDKIDILTHELSRMLHYGLDIDLILRHIKSTYLGLKFEYEE